MSFLKTLRIRRRAESIAADSSRNARFQKRAWRAIYPIRYPRFRVSMSAMRQYAAFAFGVPHDINGFHPYTMSSTYLSHAQAMPFLPRFPG